MTWPPRPPLRSGYCPESASFKAAFASSLVESSRGISTSSGRNTSLLLLLLFWQWRPIGGAIWTLENPLARLAIYGIYATGWATVLLSTFLINHFDLFGLRQVYVYLRGRPYSPIGFRTPWLYQHVRHPRYLGWLMVFWATATMTVAHLVFAVATTAYILVAIQFEERDMLRFHGNTYRSYREQIPMIIPLRFGKSRSPTMADEKVKPVS